MEEAVHGDVAMLKQAMLHDPLVGAVCNPEEVWQMTDEMLIAQAQWLPQY
jgi:alpha-galactosidase